MFPAGVDILAALPGHQIDHVISVGLASLKNGALLREAETHYDLFLTVDKNMPYQQSVKGKNLIVAVLNLPNQRLEGYAVCLRNLAPMLKILEPGRFYIVEPERE